MSSIEPDGGCGQSDRPEEVSGGLVGTRGDGPKLLEFGKEALDQVSRFVVRCDPLELDDAEAANRLPPHHKDPMDRMLIATALRADLTVITNDGLFSAYGVKTVW